MRILFWNLKGNANEKWISDIIDEYKIDIAIFAEYKKTKFENTIRFLGNTYVWHDGYGACDKITLLCKKTVEVTVKREQNRYTIYTCTVDGKIFNIVGIHLPSSPLSNSNDRKNIIRDIVQDIKEQENKTNNDQTIVIGDFNCNPFDEEIIQKDSFNAVLYKPLIQKEENVLYQRKKYKRFYNPIIHYISEDTCTYGSIYYSSGSAPLYWNSFDQVLVRKTLVDSIIDLSYIKRIKGTSLIKDVKPNDTISDHLPLLVQIEKGK